MKVKRMGITEFFKRIWPFSANEIKSSESVSKQPTQLIIKLNSSLQQIIDSLALGPAEHRAMIGIHPNQYLAKYLHFCSLEAKANFLQSFGVSISLDNQHFS